MRLLAGLTSPLANRGAAEIDIVCVRENSEGEYSGVGGRIHRGTPHEVAQQVGVFTRHGIERILRYGFEIASRRPRKMLASATKSNALTHSMVLWDEVAEGVQKDYPGVEYRKYHVDALAARMVTHPQTLDVIVASNLFGDILTDLGAAISGSLGIAPGANINPERKYPSMFEPIHGSAPDIAGKGIANPIGAIWAGALMLDHLGHRDLHDRVLGAIERVVANGKVRTPDLGGTSKTKDVADAIVEAITLEIGSMINDAHCHFFSTPFFAPLGGDAAIAQLGSGGTRRGPPRRSRIAGSPRLDRHQVSRAALIASVPGDAASVAAAVARHPRAVRRLLHGGPDATGRRRPTRAARAIEHVTACARSASSPRCSDSRSRTIG